MFAIICFSILALFMAYYYIRSSNDLQRFRYDSFAPVRKNNQAAWYVDGKDYMSAVADAMQSKGDNHSQKCGGGGFNPTYE